MLDFIKYCFAPYSKTKFLLLQTSICFTLIFLVSGIVSSVSKISNDTIINSGTSDNNKDLLFDEYKNKIVYNDLLYEDSSTDFETETKKYAELMNNNISSLETYTTLKTACIGELYPDTTNTSMKYTYPLSYDLSFYTNDFDLIKYRKLDMLYFSSENLEKNSIIISEKDAEYYEDAINNFKDYSQFKDFQIFSEYGKISIAGIYKCSDTEKINETNDFDQQYLIFGSNTLYNTLSSAITLNAKTDIFITKKNISDSDIEKMAVLLPNITGSIYLANISNRSMVQIYDFINNINILVITINILIFILILFLINDDVVKNNKIDLIFFKNKNHLLFKIIFRNFLLYIFSIIIAIIIDFILFLILKFGFNIEPKFIIDKFVLIISFALVVIISSSFGILSYKKTSLMKRE